MLEQDEFLTAAGVTDLASGQRMLRRSSPSKAPRKVLEAAAVAVGLPAAFAISGAEAIAPDEPGLVERVEALEEQVRTLVRQIGADERRRPPGALGRDTRGSSPSPLHPAQDDSIPAEGSRPGSGEA